MQTKTILKSAVTLLFALILIPLSYSASQAGINDDAGTSAFSFLKINVGARPVAMGGAFTGLADDETALYYNPAGIARLEEDRFIAGYNNMFVDMQSGFIGLIRKQDFDRSYALYASYLNLGDFVQTDRLGNITGEFGGTDFVFGATYAVTIKESYALGVSAKFIYESVQDFSSTGIAFDIGAHYRTFRGRFQAGLMVQNIGVQLSSLGSGDTESLPTTFRLGSALRLRGLPVQFTGDLILPVDNDIDFAIGGEYFELKPVFLRLGWNSFGSNFRANGSDDNLAGFSAGIGIDIKKRWHFAYSVSPGADLGDSHRITVTGGM